jgi:galactokinase
VTGLELDALVEAAWDAGAVGARMTGAGFGGCTINLVKKTDIDPFIDKVGLEYMRKTGLRANFYTVSAGPGTHEKTTVLERNE